MKYFCCGGGCFLKGDAGEPGMAGLPGVEGIQVGMLWNFFFNFSFALALMCYHVLHNSLLQV